MDIFPMVQPNTEEAETDPEYPLYRDVKWDLRENKPIFKWGGELRKHFSKERCSQTAMPFFAVFPLYFGLFLSPVQNQMHR